MGGDEGLLVNLIGYFREDAPEMLRKLSSAIEKGEAEQASRFAHSLKGLAANYDACFATDLAQEVETSCRQGDLSAAAASLNSLRQRVDELKVALEQWQSDHA